MKSVGIVGLDYCGSTLINNVLSGLPNCIGVGESHWIIDHEKSNRANVERCTECGTAECPVFSHVVIDELRKIVDTKNASWWKTISEASNCDIVISGDKRPYHYERLGIPDKLIMIVKDPRAHLVSWAIRKFSSSRLQEYNKGQHNFQLSDEEFEFSLNFWIRETRKHITWSLGTEKPTLAISLESFITGGPEYLQEIATWIGADFVPEAVDYWKTDLHYIGGNHSVKRMADERYFFRRLRLDKRWTDVLNEEQQIQILEDPRVSEQLNRLTPYSLQNESFFHTE